VVVREKEEKLGVQLRGRVLGLKFPNTPPPKKKKEKDSK
jgi:hypothetical protein